MISTKALVVVVFVGVCCPASRAMDAPSTIGSDFVFAIPSDYVFRRTPSQRIYLSSQTGQAVFAQIVASGSNFRRQLIVPADQEIVVDLPSSVTSRHTGLKQITIAIRADGDISVHVQMDAGVNSGAFTPIPTRSLGRDYVVAIYEPLLPRYRSGFVVTAAERGALLQVRFSRNIEYGYVSYGPERLFKFHLKPFESFQVMDEVDLTGTRIESDHPVAVVVGSECSRVPRGIKYCDYLVEQLPPVHTLGKDFIVAPFRGRETSYVIRIVAPFNETDIEYSSESFADVRLQANQHHELIFDRHVELSFRSTKPILVVEFMKGYRSGDYVGDPSMVVVPPIEQFIDGSLTFVSMARDHVTVMITNTNMTIAGLHLNGKRVPRDWSTISDDVAAVLHGTLETGIHTISHLDRKAKFLVIGYGTGYLSSRAFPLAYNLKRLYVPSKTPLLIPPQGYSILCLNTSMLVTLDRSVFLINRPNDVTLNDPDCRPIVEEDLEYGLVVLRTNFDSCGTEVQEYDSTVTFSNTLWFAESVITPVSPMRDLPFKCVIEQQAGIIGVSSLTSGSLQPDHSVVSDEVLGDLTLSLTQYMDDTFLQGATGNASTNTAWDDIMEGTQGQNLFAVNVTSSVDASVFVDSCWTTPGPNARDQNSKDIINDGCGIDDTIRIGASIDDPRFRPIGIDSFSPIGEYHEVFMHCRVQVCRGVDSGTRCSQECRRDSRKRRDTTKPRDLYILSTGPIHIK